MLEVQFNRVRIVICKVIGVVRSGVQVIDSGIALSTGKGTFKDIVGIIVSGIVIGIQ